MFRFKRGVPIDYDTQKYIYSQSRQYRRLTASEKRNIERLCMMAGKEHYKALLEFVTTDTGATTVCTKHYLSQSTLERAVRRYYLEFAKQL